MPAGYTPSPLERSPLEATLTTGPHSLLDPGEQRDVRLPQEPYGGGRRSGWRRFLPSWQVVVGTILCLIILLVVLVLVAYARTPIPEANKTALNQTTVVYWSDGKTELGRWQQEDRQIIKYNDVPASVRNAVLSAEDRSFETNQGISPTGIARAAWKNLRGEPLQGGSTITQQYVKNYFLTSDRSYSRKWKELFISVKVARVKDKWEILETYLNTVYFGRRAHGIEAASRAYFQKPTSQLSVSEGAYLAGILNGPELYDPDDGEESKARATARWNYVLDGMVKMGTLSPQERAKQTFPNVRPQVHRNRLKGQNGYLMQMVAAELGRKAKIGQDALETGGYRVVTTFNRPMVENLKRAVAEEFEQNKKLKIQPGSRMGSAVVDPRSGAVRAIYGGTQDYNGGQNAATQDYAQPGSQMKVFAIITALQQTKAGKGKISLNSTFDGRSPQHFEGYADDKDIQNEGNRSYSARTSLIKATAKSINTVFMNLNQEVGAPNTRRTAIAAGIPEDHIDNTLGNVLGGSESVHPLDMAEAYATIASGGIHHETYSVQALKGPDGKQLYSGVNQGERVFDADVIADVTYAMQAVTKPGGTAYESISPLKRPVAGKTGTSDEHKSGWFNGFTPQLEMVVGLYRTIKVGNTYKAVEVKVNGELIHGGDYPAKVWANFMARTLDGQPVLEFPEKADIRPADEVAPDEEDYGDDEQTTTSSPTFEPPKITGFDPTPSESTRRTRTRTSDDEPTQSTSETETSTETQTQDPDPQQSTSSTTNRGGGGGGGGSTVTGRPGNDG